MGKTLDTGFIIGFMMLFLIIGIIDYYFNRPAITNSQSQIMTSEGIMISQGVAKNVTMSWNVAINFTTHDVFSVQTPLDVSVIAIHEDGLPHDNADIIFLGAMPENPKYVNGHLNTVRIPLTIDPKNNWYAANGTIFYFSEGDKCAIIDENDSLGDRRYEPCPPNHDPVIHISAADSKYQYEANKTTLFILWIGIGISLVSIYYYLREVWKKPSTNASSQPSGNRNKH